MTRERSVETPGDLAMEAGIAGRKCVQNWSKDVSPDLFGDDHSEGGLLGERPASPVPSVTSMKDDASITVPIFFRSEDAHPETRLCNGRPASPVPSAVSLSSNWSKDVPIYFSGDVVCSEERFQTERAASPVPTCISMKSDSSMNVPLLFRAERLEPEEGSTSSSPTLMNGTVHSQLDSLSPVTEVLSRVLDKHKYNMKNKCQSLIEGVGAHGRKTHLNSIFTQLYIIDGESDGVNKEHEVLEMESRPSKKHFQEAPINCLDIFKPREGTEEQKLRTVLTKGIAGIGKTVSVQKFILDWSERKANQDIDFMFVLPFRELNLIKNAHYSLHQLICAFHPELSDLKPEMYGVRNVVFVFDGLDESRLSLDFPNAEKVSALTSASSIGVLMSNLIQGDLLPSARIWITSRPAAANQIPRRYIQRMTEIQGFSDPQKDEYFRKKIGDRDRARKIISHVKSTRSLHIMCHIPVFCLISATVLQEIMSGNDRTEAPRTLVEIYAHFLLIQAKTKNQKYEQTDVRDAQKLLDACRRKMLKLAELAFRQLMNGNVIFYEEDLKKCGIDVAEASVYSGVCTEIFREERVLCPGKVYSFVHLSFQEFFAAFYTFHCYLTKNMEVLRHFTPEYQEWTEDLPLNEFLNAAVDKALQSDNGQLDLFLRFLLGISLESNQTLLQGLLSCIQSSSESIRDTVQYIKWKIQKEDLLGDRSVNLFLCLTEMKDQSLSGEIQDYLQSEKRSEKKLSASHCTAIAYMLQISDQVLDELDLKSYNTSQEGRYRLIPAITKCTKALFAGCNLTKNSYETITSALELENCPLRELDLSNNDLQDSGVKLLANGLRSSHCRLETLRLAVCNLKEKTCEELRSVLEQPGGFLRELDLSNNDLQDSGVKLLANGLRSSHCRLETLRLSGCGVTGEGCVALASALISNPFHLRELDLSYNHPGESGLRLLSERQEDPECRLETLRADYAGKDRLKPGLRKYACELTLDPNTAHPRLFLSEGNCRVTQVKDEQGYPDHPERFEHFNQVMCREPLSGRCYWEAEWSGGEVVIAMSYKGIPRKGGRGNSVFGATKMSWKIDCSSNSCTAWHDKKRTDVPAPASCSNRVGVYLDFLGGTLSFYSASPETQTQTHLQTYRAAFTEPLYAGFWVDIDSSVRLCHME